MPKKIKEDLRIEKTKQRSQIRVAEVKNSTYRGALLKQ